MTKPQTSSARTPPAGAGSAPPAAASGAPLHLAVNGKTVAVPAGATLLDAIRAAGAQVPTLCHHPAVAASGACRVCTVELVEPGAPTPRLVTACTHPASHGAQVRTESDGVQTVRRTVFELLLARNGAAAALRELAYQWGVFETPYPAPAEPDTCVRCGLCVRVCQQQGTNAIDFTRRGHELEVGPPFLRLPPDCIGCGSCATICPTGHIAMTTAGHQRTIWGRRFQLLACADCGVPTVSAELRDFQARQHGVAAATFEACPACKAKATGHTFAAITLPPAASDAGGVAAVQAEAKRQQLEQALASGAAGRR